MQSFYNNGGMVGAGMDIGNPSFYQLPNDVQFVGYASATSNTASVTVNLTALNTSASIQEGDLVLVFGGASASAVAPTISISTNGYIQLVNISGNDTYDTRFIVGKKIMRSTPDTSVTLTESGANFVVATAYVFRNVAGTLDVLTATGGNTGQWNSPSVTPTPVNSGRVLIISAGASADQTGYTAFPPTGYNNNNSSINVVGAVGTVLGVGTKVWTSGAEDPGVWTGVSMATSASWAACTIVLYSNSTNLNQKNSGIWNMEEAYEQRVVAPDFTDSFNPYTNWNTSEGLVEAASRPVYIGTQSLRKIINGTASDTYKLLGISLTRPFTLDSWLYSVPPRSVSPTDRIFVCDSLGNGYGFNADGTSIFAEIRTNYSPTALTNSASWNRTEGVWYRIRLKANANNTFTVQTYNTSGTLLASVTSVVDTTHSGPFDRIHIAGGYPFYVGQINLWNREL